MGQLDVERVMHMPRSLKNVDRFSGTGCTDLDGGACSGLTGLDPAALLPLKVIECCAASVLHYLQQHLAGEYEYQRGTYRGRYFGVLVVVFWARLYSEESLC